jgi:hypothetical protein
VSDARLRAIKTIADCARRQRAAGTKHAENMPKTGESTEIRLNPPESA